MGLQIVWQFMAKGQIHPPGQQQVVHGGHQPQPIAVAQLRGLEAEINVRTLLMTPHRPRAKQPNCLQLRLGCQQLDQALLGLLGNARNGLNASLADGHEVSACRRCASVLRSC